MRQHALIGALVVAGAGGGADAAPVALNEEELRAAVVGKTVKIDTPLGVPLTVQIGANGIMHGTAGTALALYLGSAKDRGRWRVRDGKLCQKWFKWLDAEESCLSIRLDGLKVYWRRDDGRTGTAMIEPGPPVLAGTSASGLGLPPEPAPPAAAADAEPAPAPMPAVVAPVAPLPAAVGRDFARPRPEPRQAPLAAPLPEAAVTAGEPQLIEGPRVVARRPAEGVKLAAFAPLGHGTDSVAAAIGLGSAVPDPFDADVQPMRWAADQATIATIEHRWCLADVFGRLQPPLFPVEGPETPEAAGISATPSLVMIVLERTFTGELPLPEAACLTAEPALLSLPPATISQR